MIDLPGAKTQPGYALVLVAAAWHAYLRGDYERAEQLRQQALEAEAPQPDTALRPRVELDACNLTAMAALAAGDYERAVAAYARGAELAAADGYPGLAAINIAVGVNAALLGGIEPQALAARADEALTLARRSGMHAAIVISLNSLALTLADVDPPKAGALLQESIARDSSPDEASPSGVLTACLVAGRLADWNLTLALASRSMHLERWVMAPLQVAPCLAMCARALAETRPDIAGVLHGAAISAFRRAAAEVGTSGRPASPSTNPNANFVLSALHDVSGIVSAALGDQRGRELRDEGKRMSMDEAITFALAHVDPQLAAQPRWSDR